jgi:hypothetical protein
MLLTQSNLMLRDEHAAANVRAEVVAWLSPRISVTRHCLMHAEGTCRRPENVPMKEEKAIGSAVEGGEA